MKIKLVLLEKDLNYLKRVVSAFETKYFDKLEIYSFSNKEKALAKLAEERIDIMLASDLLGISAADIPKRTSLAYLVDAGGIDIKDGCPAISKYQKAELMYKQILGIYAEHSEAILGGLGVDNEDGGTQVVAFSSPCGGVGTSSLAAAFSLHAVRNGKRVLYLDLQKISATDSIFSAEGQECLSDIIYALKKRTNLAIKLESCVKQDARGVFFFSQAKEALDMMELSVDETERLIQEIKATGEYDYVVVDLDFSLDRVFLELLKKMNRVVVVSDGSNIANAKISRAMNSISIVDKKGDLPSTSNWGLFYNKFSNKVGRALEGVDLPRIGGAPRFERADAVQVIEELSGLDALGEI